jgi:hypothetical protein
VRWQRTCFKWDRIVEKCALFWSRSYFK